MAWAQTNFGDNNVGGAVDLAASAFSSPLTPGSIIFVVFAAADAGTVPTDTAGNTYIPYGGGAEDICAAAAVLNAWYAVNSSSTASNVVTTHASGAIYNAWAFEFTGNAASSPIDDYSSQASLTSEAPDANSYILTPVTSTVNGALILGFGAGCGPGAFTSPGTSPNAFTSILTSGSLAGTGICEYFIQTTAATITPTAGGTQAQRFASISIAVKPFVAAALDADDNGQSVATIGSGLRKAILASALLAVSVAASNVASQPDQVPPAIATEDYVLRPPPAPTYTNVTLCYGDDSLGTEGPPVIATEDYAFRGFPPDLWYENIQVGMGSEDAVGILTEDYDVGGLGFGIIKPVLQTYRRPDYQIQEQNESAGALAPLVEEEYAFNRVSPSRLTYWRHPLFSLETDDFPFLTGMMEESYYLQPVPPVQMEYKRPLAYSIDSQEDYIPIPSTIEVDESEGINLVRPTRLKYLVPPYNIFVDMTPELAGQLVDDYALHLIVPVQSSFRVPPYSILDQQESPTLAVSIDEDYCLNLVSPVRLTYRASTPWIFVEQYPNFIAYVTGIIQNLAGQGIPGFIKFRLQNFGNAVPRVIPTGSIAKREYKVQADNNGYFSIPLWGNDLITPVGTLYQVTVYNQYGTRMAENTYSIAGSSFDLSGQGAPADWQQRNYGDNLVYNNLVGFLDSSAFANPLTPGSLIVVGSQAAVATGDPAYDWDGPPTDTAGNIYIEVGAGTPKVCPVYNSISVWYAVNNSSISNNVVTVHTTSGAAIYNVLAVEFTGNTASSPLHAVNAQGLASGGVAGANGYQLSPVTTTVNGALVISFGNGCTEGFTLSGTSPNLFTSIYLGMFQYFLQPTPATITPMAGGVTGSSVYGSITVAFKPG